MLPVIDRILLLKRVDGNAALASRLIGDFRNDHSDAADRVSAQLEMGRRDDARRLAHLLRGFAGNLGMLDLAAAARDVEAL
ncbi:MAG: Hpt domain-containing protein, partial [Alphaproteobacteria bacterium]|nr:Hpt domain-containing protein [Alphaproteobacteria bacterium]